MSSNYSLNSDNIEVIVPIPKNLRNLLSNLGMTGILFDQDVSFSVHIKQMRSMLHCAIPLLLETSQSDALIQDQFMLLFLLGSTIVIHYYQVAQQAP